MSSNNPVFPAMEAGLDVTGISWVHVIIINTWAIVILELIIYLVR